MYIDDIGAKDFLYGYTVRSFVAQRKIKKVNLPSLPDGVIAVSARDIPGSHYLNSYGYHIPFLASTECRYPGEPILLLAAPDRDLLYALAEQVRIDYGDEAPSSVKSDEIHFTRGHPGRAFQEAYQIVEGEYRVGAQAHYYCEPQGAVASWDGKSLLLHSATQDPFCLRRECAAMLDLTLRRVRVKIPRMGDPLDGKLMPSIFVAAHAGLLAFHSGKMIKLGYTQREDLLYTPKSNPGVIRHRSALDREGKLTAMKVEIRLDGGAYIPVCSQELVEATLAACGGYACRNLEVQTCLSTSGGVPAGSFLGSGRSQAFFAMELHAARLEEICHIDPVAWKKLNLITSSGTTSTGGKMRGDPRAVMD